MESNIEEEDITNISLMTMMMTIFHVFEIVMIAMIVTINVILMITMKIAIMIEIMDLAIIVASVLIKNNKITK